MIILLISLEITYWSFFFVKNFARRSPGHVVQDTVRKNALARLLDSFRIHVCGKDLQISLDVQFVHNLPEQDGQRICLLAGGAARAPHTDRLLRSRSFHYVVNSILLQAFKKDGSRKKFVTPMRISFTRILASSSSVPRNFTYSPRLEL